MKEGYRHGLKCKYWGGLFPHEYFIKFRPYDLYDQDWCFIDKRSLVKKINEENGIVGVYAYSIKGDKVLIGIMDVGDHRESRFYVPKTELTELKYLKNEKA